MDAPHSSRFRRIHPPPLFLGADHDTSETYLLELPTKSFDLDVISAMLKEKRAAQRAALRPRSPAKST